MTDVIPPSDVMAALLVAAEERVDKLMERLNRYDADEFDMVREFYGLWCRFHRAKNLQARLIKAEAALPESHRTPFDLDELSYLAQKMVELHHGIEEFRAAKGYTLAEPINPPEPVAVNDAG